MKRIVAAAAFLLALCASDVALALAQRTFVASTGSDTWPCSRTQPCRSFATAIGKTSDKGEVIVLDSGGYGVVTITQSASLIAPAGVYAGISVFSNNGITIDGSGITVVLRGLSIDGQGGDRGIVFNQGSSLTIEDCEIANLTTTGIEVRASDSRVTIRNSTLRNQYVNMAVNSTPGAVRATVVDSIISDGSYGVQVWGAFGAHEVSVTRSIVTGNGIAFWVRTNTAGESASLLSDGNAITYSTSVFQLVNFGGSATAYTAGNNTVGYYDNLVVGGTLTPCCAT